jgi:hypothetical protein
MVAGSPLETHLADRLHHTRTELAGLGIYRTRQKPGERLPASENPRKAGPQGF